jgi:hypothetical protein
MDGGVPPFVPYDLTAAKRLKNQFDNLRTFGEVAVWDREAQEEIERIRRWLDGLSATEAHVAEVEAAATRAHGNKSQLRLPTPDASPLRSTVSRFFKPCR